MGKTDRREGGLMVIAVDKTAVSQFCFAVFGSVFSYSYDFFETMKALVSGIAE